MNPDAISLRPDDWEAEGLLAATRMTTAEARQRSEGMEAPLEELRSICAPVANAPGGGQAGG